MSASVCIHCGRAVEDLNAHRCGEEPASPGKPRSGVIGAMNRHPVRTTIVAAVVTVGAVWVLDHNGRDPGGKKRALQTFICPRDPTADICDDWVPTPSP